MVVKKSYYKPLYKKFIRLKKNIQNRKKLLNKFKKKKWLNLITFLRVSSRRRKKNFNNFNQHSFFVPKFGNSYKRKYLNNLLLKQRFSLFYGNLSDKILKHNIKKARKSIHNNKLSVPHILLNLFECRLDTVLYRAHFSKSIRDSRLLIQHKHVLVNNQLMTLNTYVLKPGDIITLKGKGVDLVNFNVYRSNLWPITPNHLHVNYRTYQIAFLSQANFFEISTQFPFWLDLNTLVTYRKY